MLSLLSWKLSSFFKIAFISNDIFFGSFVDIFLYFLKPIFDVFEGLSICDIIDNNDSVGSSVIAAGDGFETILYGCVPLCYEFSTT